MTAWILALFLTTSAADSITTYQAVQRGAREGNPILAPMGLRVSIGVKSAVAVGVVIGVAKTPEHKKPLLIALACISVAQGFVAYRNYRMAR